MGFTHYVNNAPKKHDAATFKLLVDDVKKVIKEVQKQGIVIAGGQGTGKPELTKDLICFNGTDEGDLGHETLYIAREGDGGFSFCKTARKPYDLAVVAALICYKYRFPEIKFSSDGDLNELEEGRLLAEQILGLTDLVLNEDGDDGITLGDEVKVDDAKTQKYLSQGGNFCLHCNSKDIEGQGFEMDGSSAYQTVRCNQCGTEWQDIYTLSGVDNIKPGP